MSISLPLTILCFIANPTISPCPLFPLTAVHDVHAQAQLGPRVSRCDDQQTPECKTQEPEHPLPVPWDWIGCKSPSPDAPGICIGSRVSRRLDDLRGPEAATLSTLKASPKVLSSVGYIQVQQYPRNPFLSKLPFSQPALRSPGGSALFPVSLGVAVSGLGSAGCRENCNLLPRGTFATVGRWGTLSCPPP